MDTPENVYEAAEYATKQLGLSSHFVLDILREDDWSFVIKTHALMEAAVTTAIRHRLADLSIDGFLGRLQLRRCLELAEELQAIDAQLLTRIRFFSQIRNEIVHDVTKCSFSFAKYLSNQDQRNAFQGLFLQGVSGSEEVAGHKVERRQLLMENPKLAVIVFLIELLVNVYLQECKALSQLTHLKLGESFVGLSRRDETGSTSN